MKEKHKKRSSRVAQVQELVGCQYFGCTKSATHRMVRASKYFCSEHIAMNMIRFGCDFEVDELKPNAALEGRGE